MQERNSLQSISYLAAAATVTTTAAIGAGGEVENRSPAPALNAISHILFGRKAARKDDASAKYTGTGLALNAAAMGMWAAVHHVMFRPDQRRRPDPLASLARGAATAGVAYVVDYHVVPKRLTPGFEKRLSGAALFGIYAALAAGLAIGERLAAAPASRARRGHPL